MLTRTELSRIIEHGWSDNTCVLHIVKQVAKGKEICINYASDICYRSWHRSKEAGEKGGKG